MILRQMNFVSNAASTSPHATRAFHLVAASGGGSTVRWVSWDPGTSCQDWLCTVITTARRRICVLVPKPMFCSAPCFAMDNHGSPLLSSPLPASHRLFFPVLPDTPFFDCARYSTVRTVRRLKSAGLHLPRWMDGIGNCGRSVTSE